MARPRRSKAKTPKRQQKAAGSSAAESRRPAPPGPQGDILALQHAAGNRAVGHLLQSDSEHQALIQTKLSVGQPGERSEQEADRVATQLMRRPEAEAFEGTAVSAQIPGAHIGRLHPEGTQQQRRDQTVSDPSSEVMPALEADLNASRSGDGQPLPDTVRASFEVRFGHDFRDVRLHSDSPAQHLAAELGARAFTSGTDIWFGPNQGPDDQKLLAHELAHVVQQSGGEVGIQRQPAPASELHRPSSDTMSARSGTASKLSSEVLPRADVVFQEGSNRWLVTIGGIPVAEIAVRSKETPLEVRIDIVPGSAAVTVRHYGDAALAPVADPGATLALSVRLREIDMRQGAPDRAGPKEPTVPGEMATGTVDVVIAPPSAIRWPDEPAGELSIKTPIPPGALSEFEEKLRADPRLINGVVMDPSNSGEVIGYRVFATAGVTRLVDREGNEVFLDEIGLETPLVDPLDFIPTPGSAGKVGAGIIGRVGVKALGKKAAVSGTKVPLSVIARMRGVSKALAGRALRKGAAEAPGFVRKITKAGLDHSFDRHAAEWFGRAVSRETHFAAWRELVERVAASRHTFPWSLRGATTIAHLGRLEGKGRYFVVQFFEETGELATAFTPNPGQLREMFKLLKGVP